MLLFNQNSQKMYKRQPNEQCRFICWSRRGFVKNRLWPYTIFWTLVVYPTYLFLSSGGAEGSPRRISKPIKSGSKRGSEPQVQKPSNIIHWKTKTTLEQVKTPTRTNVRVTGFLNERTNVSEWKKSYLDTRESNWKISEDWNLNKVSVFFIWRDAVR